MSITEVALPAGEYNVPLPTASVHRAMLKERRRLVDMTKLSGWAFNSVEEEHVERPSGTPWYFCTEGDRLRVFPTPRENITIVLLSLKGDDDGPQHEC